MSQVYIDGKPVFFPVDQKPRRVHVTGDGVSYGDLGVTHAKRNGYLANGEKITLGVGQWIVSEGNTLLTIEEVDEKPEVVAPEEPKAKKAKAKRKPAAKKITGKTTRPLAAVKPKPKAKTKK